MSSGEKEDKILELLYSMKPVVESMANTVDIVVGRVGRLEMDTADIKMKVFGQSKDIDALGSAHREHKVDMRAHQNVTQEEFRFGWTTALTVIGLLVAAIGLAIKLIHG